MSGIDRIPFTLVGNLEGAIGIGGGYDILGSVRREALEDVKALNSALLENTSVKSPFHISLSAHPLP